MIIGRLVVILGIFACSFGPCNAQIVEVYTVDKCKYCQEVKTYLKEHMVEFKEILLDSDDKWGEMQRRAMEYKDTVKKFGKPKKVLVLAPQVFVDNVYIGTHRKPSHLQKLGAALSLSVGEPASQEDGSDLLSDDECNTCAKGEVQWEESEEGEVIAMGDGDFEDRTKEGFWLVKFYAPWCPHCSKLAPVLEKASISNKIKGSMQFVKIDATNHTMLAEKYKTTSFPRLFWKRDGAMHRYLGGKKVEDFEAFVQRMNKPAVVTEPPVDQDVYFRLTSKSNGEVSKAFTAVAKAMQDQATFVQGNGDGEAVVERVQQEGKVQTYKGKPDAKELEAWVRGNRFPTVMELRKTNFKEVSRFYRKLLVVGVYSKDQTKDGDFFSQLGALSKSSVAEGGGSSNIPEVAVGKLDGVEWIKYVNSMGLYNVHLPQIFVLESNKDRSYVQHDLPKTSADMEQFVSGVLSGAVMPKYSSYSALWTHEGPTGVARQYGVVIAGATTVLSVVFTLMCQVAAAEYEGDEEPNHKKKD
jgi:glutaredoxin